MTSHDAAESEERWFRGTDEDECTSRPPAPASLLDEKDEYGYTTEYITSLHGNPAWEAIWRTIKGWDISRLNNGLYCEPTGDDATRIYDAVLAALPAPAVRPSREDVERAEVAMRDYGHAYHQAACFKFDDGQHNRALNKAHAALLALAALSRPTGDTTNG